MPTIDHPLLQANRILSSGVLDEAAMSRIAAEWWSGDRTPARLRASIFDVLGDTFRGCVPVAIEDVIDPDFARETLGAPIWAALGPIDDGSVLRLDDGTWFLIGPVDEKGMDREMVLFRLAGEDDAKDLKAMLAEGRSPIWAVPAVNLLPMGSEREYRAFMETGELPAG